MTGRVPAVGARTRCRSLASQENYRASQADSLTERWRRQAETWSRLAGGASLAYQDQGQGWRIVLGSHPQNPSEAPSLLVKVVLFACQPEPGADCEGARAMEKGNYEDSYERPEMITRE